MKFLFRVAVAISGLSRRRLQDQQPPSWIYASKDDAPDAPAAGTSEKSKDTSSYQVRSARRSLPKAATASLRSKAGPVSGVLGRGAATARHLVHDHVNGIPRLWAANLVIHRQPHVAQRLAHLLLSC